MNPWALLAGLVLWVATAFGAFFYGQNVGSEHEIAKAAAVKDAIAETRLAANLGAADAIAKIKITNTTLQGRLQTIIKDNPVYVDCKHTPDGLRNLNDALGGRAGPTGGGVVP